MRSEGAAVQNTIRELKISVQVQESIKPNFLRHKCETGFEGFQHICYVNK